MVHVGDKDVTERVAVAEGLLRTRRETLAALSGAGGPKGDALTTAVIAGIQGAKRTPELIPLCHPLPLDGIDVHVEPDESLPGLRARATVRVSGRTGVEMEALTAVSMALLTAYDMLKAVDRTMEIGEIRLVRKTGGRSRDRSDGQ